jgi:DnaJ-class molecular chaperone
MRLDKRPAGIIDSQNKTKARTVAMVEITCPRCDGAKEIQCPNCNGVGERSGFVCPRCIGRCEIPCPRCKGKGVIIKR